jgi:hypothetical protein
MGWVSEEDIKAALDVVERLLDEAKVPSQV